MFHSVGLEETNWISKYLSIPFYHFEEWFIYLNKNNYQTSFLEDWYNNPSSINIEDKKKIVLSFDDGYLDNWVYLFPLLEKYQIKATIFINPEFCDSGKCRYPTLNDVWSGHSKLAELQALGYLNWQEIQTMHNSGLVDIQSHSMSHNWYFSSNNLNDIYLQPNYAKYYWLDWILNPDSKPYHMSTDRSIMIPEGYPIFSYGRSLGIRKYIQNEALNEFLKEEVRRLDKKSPIELVNEAQSLLLQCNYLGRMESDEELINRYTYELEASKEILESKLNKNIEYLCWPGGSYNKISIELSKKVGYKASTISSSERADITASHRYYKRIPRYNLAVNINYKKKNTIDYSPSALKNSFIEFEGSWLKKYERYIKKLYYIAFK